MSHFTTIQTEIKDIDALRDACGEMGLSLINGGHARGYGNNRHAGDYVIRLNGPYDIAVNCQSDGSYGLTCDWWGGHVEKEVGAGYGRLLQHYGIHKATREARKRGHSVRRVRGQNGNIKLTIGGIQ